MWRIMSQFVVKSLTKFCSILIINMLSDESWYVWTEVLL